MKKIIALFICIISVGLTCAQKVNQLNEQGKKTGFWEVKLDKNLIPTDSDKYSYIVYDRYDENGAPIYLYERNINKLFKIKDSLQTNLDELDNQKLLTGTAVVYIFNDEYEEWLPIRTEKYKEGHPIFIENKTYDENGDITNSYTFDFLCSCRDTGYSYQRTKNGDEYCFYNGPYGWTDYYTEPLIWNDDEYVSKYPYFINTPPLVGLTGGYNFIKNNQIELGIMLNVVEVGLNTGGMAGYHLSYARPLDRNLNTIGLDMGVYSPITLGMGVNSNFDDQKNHILGFKVFGGVTFYHTSLIYEYNMFRNSKNAVLDLNHHALKLRVTVPLFRIWK